MPIPLHLHERIAYEFFNPSLMMSKTIQMVRPMLEGIPVGKVSPWALVRSYVRRSFVRSFANFNFAKAGARPADGRLGGRGPSLGKIKICFLGGGVGENLQFGRKSAILAKI